MPTRIKFIINYINDLLLFTEKNNIVVIIVKDTDNNIDFKEYLYINSLLDDELHKKEYYIVTNYYDIYSNPLTLFNFIFNFDSILKLNSNAEIIYKYNYDDQIIYFFNTVINLPITMIGLINYNQTLAVVTISDIEKISGENENYNKLVSLNNNNLNDYNSLELPGDIISINNMVLLDAVNLSFNYYLFETNVPIIISDLTKIYFYDPTFIRIINIPFNDRNNLIVDALNVLVELVNSSSSVVYSYITNLNFNKVDAIEKSSYILSFKNYIDNIEFSSITLKIFDYDYYIYFSTLVIGDYIKCKPIDLNDINLYDILIGSNSQIPTPTILNLDINNYNTNLNLNQINNIFNISNDLVENFLYSSKEKFEILLNYLLNYKIKNYNFYNITFVNKQNNSLNIINYLNKKVNNSSIKSNNLMLNLILSNIQIFFKNKTDVSNSYNIFGMIFNNNNTWDIYTKKYLLDNPLNKYTIIKDLLIMAINYTQIVIYNYSDLDDLNLIKIPLLNNVDLSYINPYYKYNKLIVNKDNSKLVFGLDENFYLKLYIEIKVDYVMLIFYSDTQIPSTNLKVLNFKTNGFYNFKIYQISKPNGSVITDKYEYSILFQNIEECNDFIYWINNGSTIKPPNTYSTYFNIEISKSFELNSDNFYVPSTNISNVIYFRILNLDLNIGNVFVNNQIIFN